MGTGCSYTQSTRMNAAVSSWALALFVAAVPFGSQAPVPEAAILRAAISDWQEGPTDGRICLDARILPPSADRPPASGPVWGSAILDALLADTLVALALGTLPASGAYRVCSPSRTLPRLSMSRPVRTRGDYIVTSAAENPAESSDKGDRLARPFRVRTLIGRRAGRWIVLDHFDMPFKVVRVPVS
jgi:hypothetical protein